MGTKVLCLWSFRWAVRLKEHIPPECWRRWLSVSVYVIENSTSRKPGPGLTKAPSVLTEAKTSQSHWEQTSLDRVSEQGQDNLPFIQHVSFQNNDSPGEVGEQVNRNTIGLDIRISSRSVLSLCCEIVALPYNDLLLLTHLLGYCSTTPPNLNWMLGNKTQTISRIIIIIHKTNLLSLPAENVRLLLDKTLQTSSRSEHCTQVGD